MGTLENLKPEAVWSIFDEICKVPRPSKREGKIMAYLLEFAERHGLEAKKDKLGNVLILGKATAGMEDRPTVVLQAHMDMVCEKNADTVHDFDKDPIVPVIDGDWLKASGTTLGADDGIGMAAALAVLTDKTVEHGPIEALFTVDEETGLTGAFGIETGFFSGKQLLNLDSEEENVIYIGCAGGMDTVINYNYTKAPVAASDFCVNITVRGLKGGHSGSEINVGRANAIKLLTSLLWSLAKKYGARIVSISGGNLRNAIPREAEATIVFNSRFKENVRVDLNCYAAECERVWSVTDSGVRIDLDSETVPAESMTPDSTMAILNALYACPHGVQSMSFKMPGLVESSTNLASIKMVEGDKVMVQTSQRSAVDSLKKNVANSVAAAFAMIGAEIRQGEGYPGWEPNPDSPLLKKVVAAAKKVYGEDPDVCSIHAGLECGLFLEKYPDMDMISCGPTLSGVHSPDEKCNIPSVARWYDFIKEVLKNL